MCLLFDFSERSYSSKMDFWFRNERMNFGFGYEFGLWISYTFLALLLILIFHSAKRLSSFRFFSSSSSSSFSSTKRHAVSSSSVIPTIPPSPSSSTPQQFRISDIVSEADLKFLFETLEHETDKWENVINKRNNQLSYSAKCCKPKDAPIKYLSVTVFENCKPEVLRDFYMDNHYRKQWDKTIVEHEQLQVDRMTGIEVGRTIKKFPLLTPREYVLSWRLWEGKENTFYCFIKQCEHPSATPLRKHVRVKFYRSGWRISKVSGRDACEIKVIHQEDAGLNVEMAKLAFARGIWSYVGKMNDALRKYSVTSHPQNGPDVTAVSLIQKVPPELEGTNIVADTLATPEETAMQGLVTSETKEKKFPRRPSRKVIANGLLLLGGVICLSRGHSSLGAKVAMAYILTKLSKRDASLGETRER